MLEGDIHFYPVSYEILPGVIVVVNLFGDCSGNVYAAKVSETGLFFSNFRRLITGLYLSICLKLWLEGLDLTYLVQTGSSSVFFWRVLFSDSRIISRFLKTWLWSGEWNTSLSLISLVIYIPIFITPIFKLWDQKSYLQLIKRDISTGNAILKPLTLYCLNFLIWPQSWEKYNIFISLRIATQYSPFFTACFLFQLIFRKYYLL